MEKEGDRREVYIYIHKSTQIMEFPILDESDIVIGAREVAYYSWNKVRVFSMNILRTEYMRKQHNSAAGSY